MLLNFGWYDSKLLVKKEAIKALDSSDMETEYEKYFPSE